MRVVMLFLDGVGIGGRDPSSNPLFAARLPALASLVGGRIPTLGSRVLHGPHGDCFPLDATLGVPGLPQSGTGQTALFAGVNAARVVGRHFGPYPHSLLRPILKQRSLVQLLSGQGRRVCFANAFPRRYFDFAAEHKNRLSVISLSCLMAGVPLNSVRELEAGTAVSADIRGEGWHALGHPSVPVISPDLAGRRLAALTEAHEFVLFEYWKTDPAGHAQSAEQAVSVLELFDGLLSGLLDAIDLRRVLVLITSDHGNIEDLSVKTHTRNPVPLYLYGHRRQEVAAIVHRKAGGPPDLTAVAPAILEVLTGVT